MGVESANYIVLPTENLEAVERILVECGAVKRDPFPASDFERWVLRSERYWIDVMTGNFAGDGRPAISVRVALSNPDDVLKTLRALLASLVARTPGTLIDRQSRKSYKAIGDREWQEMLQGWLQKRATFQQHFGPFEAAISGERVFDELRARKKR